MQTLTLNRQALLALIVATAFPLSALAGVGNVEFTTGTVNAQSADGATRTLSKGAEVNIGDTLKTLSGRMQVKFSDGGYISLQPNTEFTIDDYNYTGNSKDGKEKGFFKLIKGGLRAITGAIGKTDKESYKVSTPTATIGIRGTEYVALQDGDRLQVKVGAGAVVIQNDVGNLVLYQGQSGEVSGPSSAPQQSTETPSVTAAAPAGNSVTETTEESSTDSVYIDGNVRLDDDTLCQIGSGDCTAEVIDEELNAIANSEFSIANANLLLAGGLANIPLLNQISAAATYSGQSSFTFAGSSITADEFLYVGFHDYSVTLDVSGLFTSGTYFGQALDSSASGSLNATTGTFTYSDDGSSNIDGSTVTLNGSGALNSTDLTQASVTYTLSDLSSNTITVSNILDGTDGAFIDGTYLQTLAQGGLVNIPALGALNAVGFYQSTSAISLMQFSGSVTENLFVDFADLNSTLTVIDTATSGSTLLAGASGTLDSATGVITLTPSAASGAFSLTSASASLSASDLRQSTINYVITDGIGSQTVTNSVQGVISGY